MKEYELLSIVGTQYTDQETADIQKQISTFLEEAGANILQSHHLGKIRLAYPIKKTRHGSYILVYFDADPSIIVELNRKLALRNDILRHTILARPAGALERTFELSSYVAPLSEEAKQEKETKRTFVRSAFHKAEQRIVPPTPIAPRQEPLMSMEELDQKLDKILEGDIAENI